MVGEGRIREKDYPGPLHISFHRVNYHGLTIVAFVYSKGVNNIPSPQSNLTM
jgi:hypothetical protein